jgi:hypothetical protein
MTQMSLVNIVGTAKVTIVRGRLFMRIDYEN